MRILTIIFISIICSFTYGQTKKVDIKLDLSGQHLKSIPDSVFKKKEITVLDLGSSGITFYPPLSALVDSSANEIKELPDNIGELTNLRSLNLNGNKLTKLPNSIIKLTNLEVLDLSFNKDLDMVQELDKLKKLPNLKILKIVEVKLKKNDLILVKAILGTDTKVIATISEYMESFQ